MDVGAGRGAADGAAKRDEGQARAAQPVHHRATFGGVGMNREIDRVAVIEAEPVVDRGLAVGAHG